MLLLKLHFQIKYLTEGLRDRLSYNEEGYLSIAVSIKYTILAEY
ncbi:MULTISPECIES: hypothetical protein [Pseudanabaena]|uniref:Uncharacterized protein n=2 Tax=Pseudanabaena TaxID=1152 RepID=L8MU87_9CYAN|nr:MULTISPECIES: hypothetical protein [Pseudanabaena]ELS31026.1 hypothetical protein Pse7429DRAFT_3831 [Pseudanabaena biceps PCC 7429]MDG3496707.1 hypothetical protein [Pseudanabaena catenata USMAC16]